MTARDIWEERPITFADFSLKDGKVMTDAFARGDSEEGSYWLLILSMRWADTNEPVFKNIAEIEALPFRFRDRLARLSGKAAFVNGMRVDDPDAPPVSNGHDEAAAAGPPH